MKSQRLMAVTGVVVFAVLVSWVPLAAQDKQNHYNKHHHYQLIDMGTFGGPESAIEVPINAGNKSVNKHGVTVGYSATSTPELPTSNPLVCGGYNGLGSFITHAFQWNGAVTDLGTLPGANNCSTAEQVNAKGEITGASEIPVLDPFLGYNQSRAVRWKDGQIEDLGSFGGNQHAATGINNRGQIVGESENTIPDPYCFTGESQIRGFLWEKGVMRDLGPWVPATARIPLISTSAGR